MLKEPSLDIEIDDIEEKIAATESQIKPNAYHIYLLAILRDTEQELHQRRKLIKSKQFVQLVDQLALQRLVQPYEMQLLK